MSQENSAVVATGTILDGKFRICQEIGHGGMATVYEAENVDIGKRVAIKVLSAELATSSVVTERFMREARAAAKIRSPYICDVYDVGTYNGRPFLVMELLEGESLYERLARDRRLSWKETLRIATETALGLAQAHEANIVHRDLKPENIFLARSGGGEQGTKIVDFGLAKFYEPALEGGEAARLTKAGALFGTPAYMSPEQASAQGPVGHRSDLWALGCIVYEMLVGRTVWNVEQGVAMILAQIAGGPLPTPSRVRKDLPPAFDRWFLKALSRDENKRFSGARQMADALAVALKKPSQAELAPPPSTAESQLVDDLVAGSQAPRSKALKPLVGRTDKSPRMRTSLPAALRNNRGRVMTSLFATIALGVVSLIAWNGVQNPSRFLRILNLQEVEEPVETASFAKSLAVGQEQLADGQFNSAVTSFERAFEDGEHKAARSLRSHAQAADEAESQGICEVRGLGHPRPFEATGKTSRPSLALTGESLIYGWATTTSEKVRPIEVTRLDFALRRIAPASVLTPLTIDAHDPQLFGTSAGAALLYSRAQGKTSTIFVRPLDSQGAALGPAHALTPKEGQYAYDPHLVAGNLLVKQSTEQGETTKVEPGHWVVFSQSTHRRIHNLFLRRLDSQLKPTTAAVQLTALRLARKRRNIAAQATIGSNPDLLTIAYRHQQGANYQIRQMGINPHSAVLQTLGVTRDTAPAANSTQKPADRYAGAINTLSDSADAQSSPRIGCSSFGCITVWSDEKSGAHAALSDATTGEIIWSKTFADKGVRPSLGHSPEEMVVVWYQESRVLVAPISQTGIGDPTVVARVGGLQPSPEIVPGNQPGQWFIAWRAFEAASLEPFVAQVLCSGKL